MIDAIDYGPGLVGLMTKNGRVVFRISSHLNWCVFVKAKESVFHVQLRAELFVCVFVWKRDEEMQRCGLVVCCH